MLCGKCRKEQRVPGQRWGVQCRRDYMRNYMRTMRDAAIASEEGRASAENWKLVRTKPQPALRGALTFRPA